METCFERAIFFSWHCDIKDCAYCYMSTQPENTVRKAVRSRESILAELIISKALGWDIGFISGGIGAFEEDKFLKLLKDMHDVAKEKFWLNIGALSKVQLQKYKPYCKGVVGSIETVNPVVHDKVCPSKPIQPYLDMFRHAESLDLMKGMTIILGLGEHIGDFELLKDLIEEYGVSKVHFYGLNPQKNTAFENVKPPTKEYQAEWIRKTRESFPDIDIQCGIWYDRPDYISTLLKAGANSISKFPALRKFASDAAKQVEEEAAKARRAFRGSLTQLPDLDWDNLVPKIKNRESVMEKLHSYLKKMHHSS